MSDYQDITGTRIKYLSSDPTLESSYEGQVWYNSTTGVNKAVVGLKAWSTSSPVITARFGTAGGISDQGPQSSTIFFGGQEPSFSNKTEEYNGSGSTSAPNLPTAIAENMGCGTSTAALSFGGLTNPSTHVGESYEYDGSSWGSETDLNTARYVGGGAGTQTAGLACGGYTTTHVANTEEYNGSAWTNVNSMNTARYSLGTAGIQTSAVIAGGVTTTRVNSVEEYDGTNWTAGTNYPTTTGGTQGFGATNTTAIFAGGSTSPPTLITTCVEYDGSSFSAVPSLNNSASGGYTSGSNTAGVYLTGIRTAPGTSGSDVEEYNNSISTITAGAWASGGNLNTGRQDVGGCGTKTAGLAIGGRTGSSGPFTQSGVCEEYNGSTWSEQNDLNTARGEASGAGTQTAAVAFGGAPDSNATENYNGTSWTTSPGTLNTGRSSGASFGASYTSAVFCGGYGGARIANVEEWNGSAWANATALPEARYNAGGAGIESAGIVLGGSNAPAGTVVFSTSVEYNGSSWTAGGTNHTSLEGQGMNGVQTACISYGGPTSMTVNSSTYDGTTFATSPNLATNRLGLGASKGASITNSVGFGGSTPPNRQMTNTEEFTAETSAVTASTLTTS